MNASRMIARSAVAMLMCTSVATAGYVMWSYKYLDAPMRQVPGNRYRITSSVTGGAPLKVVIRFEFVGSARPASAYLCVLLGNSQGKTVIREIGNPEIFATSKGEVDANFTDGLPEGSKIFLCEHTNDLKAPIVPISNILDIRSSKRRADDVPTSPRDNPATTSAKHAPVARVWTGKNGKTITATFEREAGGLVYLRKPDGVSINTKRASLSSADVAYLESIR